MPRSAAKYKKVISGSPFLHNRPQLPFFARFLRFRIFLNASNFLPCFLLSFIIFRSPFLHKFYYKPQLPVLHDFCVSKFFQLQKKLVIHWGMEPWEVLFHLATVRTQHIATSGNSGVKLLIPTQCQINFLDKIINLFNWSFNCCRGCRHSRFPRLPARILRKTFLGRLRTLATEIL